MRASLTAGLLAFAAARAWAQDSPGEPVADPQVDVAITNSTRIETWRFFEPPPLAGDPDYTFVGNRSHLDLDVRAPRFDLRGGFAYVRVSHLPTNAIGLGTYGTGAEYFVASTLPFSYQLFLSELSLSAHTRDRRTTLTVGRMTHASGGEGDAERMESRSPELARIRRLRLDGRLVGPVDWSFYGRRFDGARLTLDHAGWYAGGAVFAPTQGGFEESANLTMPKVQVASAFAGIRQGYPPPDSLGDIAPTGAGARAETQVFAHLYRDRRDVQDRPDNTPRSARSVDVTITALGASQVGVRARSSGRLDWLVWGAGETGDWYGQRHRAWSAAFEAGHQWTRVSGQPWLRAGVAHASGDDDPTDDRHGTFFPMLPTMRNEALSTVHAQMNLRDAFVQVLLEPHRAATVRLDIHRLDLASESDRWYAGSGAMASDGPTFGYAGRPSSGNRVLGTTVEGTLDVEVMRYWSIKAYAGRMWGGPVVRGLFRGDRLTVWYVENVLHWTADTR